MSGRSSAKALRWTVVGALLLLTAVPELAWGQKSFLGEKAPEIDVKFWFNTDRDQSLEKLRGRPVLLVYWGMRCDICMCKPVMKKLAPLYKKHKRQGLEILAHHIHKADASEIDVFAMKNGIEFPLGHEGYSAAYELKQVPSLFLIDSKGIVVWEGRDLGGGFSRTLGNVLRTVDYMGETALPRDLKSAKRLIGHRQYGKAIEKLVDYKIDPKKPEEGRKAAEAFIKKLKTLGEREFLRGTAAIRTLNPGRGVGILEKLAVEFKGHPLSRKAILRLKEVRKDPEVAPLLKAWDLYLQFRGCLKAGNPRAATAKATLLHRKYPKCVYVKICANIMEAYDKVQ